MKKCCFCGHSRIWEINHYIASDIDKYMEKLIMIDKADTFYSGGMGAFDRMCEGIVKDLKQKYPHISLCLVVPYMSRELNAKKEYFERYYDEMIYPDLEGVFYKAAIQKRNRWMINNCNYMIACVWGE